MYYASLGNETSSARSSDSLTPLEVENLLTMLSSYQMISAADSYLLVLPTAANRHSITGIAFAENYRSETVQTSNQDPVKSSNFTAAIMYDHISVANASQLNVLVINDPIDYRAVTETSEQKLMSPVFISILKPQPSSVGSVNVSLSFRVTTADIPASQLRCAYYDAKNSSWSGSGCTAPVKNSDRYECSCNDTFWSSPEAPSTSGKYGI